MSKIINEFLRETIKIFNWKIELKMLDRDTIDYLETK